MNLNGLFQILKPKFSSLNFKISTFMAYFLNLCINKNEPETAIIANNIKLKIDI